MSKPPSTSPTTIDPAALSQVSGGTKQSPLVDQLTGILDSIKTIKNVGQQHGINPQEMMLFMMLLQQQGPSTVQVVTPGRWRRK